ncbi:hypothetical protein A6R68_17984, partial [Neotoma lepida]
NTGQPALLKFAVATLNAGGITLGTCTNQIEAAFRESLLLVVTDHKADHSPAIESSYANLPTVSKLAGVLVKQGVKKGDTVVIYMPMIPQAMYTMLACARIGAIHSLIFGGFASKELSTRIDHA